MLWNMISITVQLQKCRKQTSRALKNLLSFHYDVHSDSQQLVYNYRQSAAQARPDMSSAILCWT